MFLGGCGRFFEGTAEEMHEALNVKLASLPDETLVYCGHEYAIQVREHGVDIIKDGFLHFIIIPFVISEPQFWPIGRA